LLQLSEGDAGADAFLQQRRRLDTLERRRQWREGVIRSRRIERHRYEISLSIDTSAGHVDGFDALERYVEKLSKNRHVSVAGSIGSTDAYNMSKNLLFFDTSV
jgi:hypothetical protein